jgi:hypothetical protein
MPKISLYVKGFFVNVLPRLPVGEDEPDRADQVRREQGGLGTVTVPHARGEHDDHDEQAQGVGDGEPLPAVTFMVTQTRRPRSKTAQTRSQLAV